MLDSSEELYKWFTQQVSRYRREVACAQALHFVPLSRENARGRGSSFLSPPRGRVSFRATYHDIPQIVGFHAGCREDPTLDSKPVGLGPSPAPTP